MSVKSNLLQWGGLLAASAALLAIPVIPAAFAENPSTPGGDGGGQPAAAINLYPATQHRWGDEDGPVPNVTTKVEVNGKEADAKVKPGDALKYKISATYQKEHYISESAMWDGTFGGSTHRAGSAFYRPTLRFHVPDGLTLPKTTEITVKSGQVASYVRDLGGGDYIVYFDYEDVPSDAATIIPALPETLKTSLAANAAEYDKEYKRIHGQNTSSDGQGCLIDYNCRETGHHLNNGDTVTVEFSTKVASDAKDKTKYEVTAQGQAWAFPWTNVEPYPTEFIDLYDIKYKPDVFAGLSKEAEDYIKSIVKDGKKYQCNFAAVSKAEVRADGGYGAYINYFVVGERGVYHSNYGDSPVNAKEKVSQVGGPMRKSIQPYVPGPGDPANDKLILGWAGKTDLKKGTDYQIYEDYSGANKKLGKNFYMPEVYFGRSYDEDYPTAERQAGYTPGRYAVTFNFNYDGAVYAAPENMKNSAWMHNGDYIELLSFYTNPNCTEMRNLDQVNPGDPHDLNAYGRHAPFPPYEISSEFGVARYARPSDSPGTARFVTVDNPPKYKLGDTVFLDKPHYVASEGKSVFNGVKDTDEQGVNGVKVKVTKVVNGKVETVCNTETKDGGKYLCENLLPGDYTVTFTDLKDRDFTQVGTETQNTPDVNHIAPGDVKHEQVEGQQASVGTYKVTITDHDVLNADAGLREKVYSLGDTVFLDKDKDGIMNNQDTGVKDVSVQVLKDPTGTTKNEVCMTKTDEHGKYHCDNLVPGSYRVIFKLPNGYEFTKKAEPTTANPDANHVNPARDVQGDLGKYDVTITDSNIVDADAGIVKSPTPKYSLGNKVFLDKPVLKNSTGDTATTEYNGVQDPGEPGVQGVEVTVTKEGEQKPICTEVTDNKGEYVCNNLENGTYTVKFTDPKGRDFTVKGSGDASKDVNQINGGNTTGSYTVTIDGHNVVTADAGLKEPLYDLGDKVFLDKPKYSDTDKKNVFDGVQNDGEPGVKGVKVKVTTTIDGKETTVCETETDKDGLYLCKNLPNGTYKVQFTDPDKRDFTVAGHEAGTKDYNHVTDGNEGVGTTTVTIKDANNRDADAGLKTPVYSLGNKVFLDENGNGVQDLGERGAFAVKVVVAKDDNFNTTICDTVTSAEGTYTCDNLEPGTYKVKFTLPDGYEFTTVGNPTDNQDGNHVDSAKDVENGVGTITRTITDKNITDADAGLKAKTYTLGDKVFLDKNGNGIQDEGEPGVEGVKVTVTPENSPAGVQPQTCEKTTGKNGEYKCENLEPGTYKVKFTLPQGYEFTTVGKPSEQQDGNHVDPAKDVKDGVGTITRTITDKNITDADAGLVEKKQPTPPPTPPNPTPEPKKHNLGDKVFLDKNNDGVQNEGENGIGGVKVVVTKEGGNKPICNTTTDSSGNYLCKNLEPGNYTVTFTDPEGRTFTKVGTGSETQNVNKVTGKGTGSITVTIKDKDVLTADAGLLEPSKPPVTPPTKVTPPEKKNGTPPVLAKTGSSAAGFAGIALAVLLAGAGMVAVSRKRKPSHRA